MDAGEWGRIMERGRRDYGAESAKRRALRNGAPPAFAEHRAYRLGSKPTIKEARTAASESPAMVRDNRIVSICVVPLSVEACPSCGVDAGRWHRLNCPILTFMQEN